jgi:TPR repeat protein
MASCPSESARTQAVVWSRKAAEQGDAEAQNNLGSSYYFGQGVKQNYLQALYWYSKAAESGSAIAQNSLGAMYHDGHGVPQDEEQATVWFRKAAEQGYAAAQVNLGASYYHGQGVRQDYAEAYFWMALAASGKTEGVKQESVDKWRDDAASHLTPADLSQVQERVRKWHEEHFPKVP